MKAITLTQAQIDQLVKDLKKDIESEAWHYDLDGQYKDRTHEYESEDDDNGDNYGFIIHYSLRSTFRYYWGDYDNPDDKELRHIDLDDLLIEDGSSYDCYGEKIEITNFGEVHDKVTRYFEHY